VANFFSFDSFSSYLISFLLIGFSLRLISKNVEGDESFQRRFMPIKRIYADNILKWRGVIIFLLFVGLVWFIWVFNIKPLEINSQINLARHLVNNEKCAGAISTMEEILPKKSFLDSYLRLKYIETLDRCEKELKIDLTKKKIEILKKQIKIQPYYTRSWISLGSLTNVLIESETNPQNIENLKKEANYYFEKANLLSPKRQEVFIEWIITDLLTGEYQKAKEKAQKCIDLNSKLGDCWWQMALTNIYLGENEKAKKNIEIAGEKGYPTNSEISLLELSRAYFKSENYSELTKIYHELIKINPAYEEKLKPLLKELY
jgi:tetratricopeptide (TPR) repeat protein